MKKYLFFATALAMLVSCSSDDFVGESPTPTSQDSGAIAFVSGTKNITRATGAAAAELLHNNFVVEGIKTIDVSGTPTKYEVFDNYNVNYSENTADKTASNTANWEYVAQSILSSKTNVTEQTIKYWDWAASQYDFWAYSLGGGSATVISLAHDANLGSSAYTIEGDLTNLSKVFISDLVTAYNPTQTNQPEFGKEVVLKFRSLVTKVRLGLYETIPGYSVKSVQFYPSASGTATDKAALYASASTLPSIPTSGTSTYTVTFPKTGSSNVSDPDYNKAHVTFPTDGEKTAVQEFGTLIYGAKQKDEKSSENVYLGRTSNAPSWANSSSDNTNHYFIVLPNETGAVLTLKVDYTLESIDGTGETITVHGATALVPLQYTQWKPNYAYTYLFKISDNTNGKTDVTNGPEGLHPITLNAVVVSTEDGTQETITTVATPSITTYSVTSTVTSTNEYKTSDDIYVTATTDGSLMNLTGKATLYTVTKDNANYVATEAEVLAALNIYSKLESNTYTGRSGIKLTPVSDGLDLSKTEIPLVDGNKIANLTAGQVALIDKSKLAAGTYAFVYETSPTDPASTSTDKYEVKTITTGSVEGYYTRIGTEEPYTYSPASGDAVDGTTYYEKYTVTTNTYAIKVIKIVAGS